MAGKKNKQKRQSGKHTSSSDERLPSRGAAATSSDAKANLASTSAASGAAETPTVGPGGFPATPTAEEDKSVSVNPLPAAAGAVNPISLAPGEKVPESASAVHDNVKLDKDSYEKSDALPTAANDVVGINPMPAAPGAVNPVHLAPGEKIPQTVSGQAIGEHVKLDKDSYDRSDALPGVDENLTKMPAVSKNLIPESSLPMGSNDATISSVGPDATTAALAGAVPLEKDKHAPTISTVGPDATTAGLAGAVPKEGQVPDIVKKSQAEAGVSPEASAVPKEVMEKSMVEKQLKEEAVPDIVKESQAEAGVGPEASAVPREVMEKSEVEKELLEKVPKEKAEQPLSSTGDVGAAVGGVGSKASTAGKDAVSSTKDTASSAKDSAKDPATSAKGSAAVAKDNLKERATPGSEDTDLRTAVNNVADRHINDSPNQQAADATAGQTSETGKQHESDSAQRQAGESSSQKHAAADASRTAGGKAPEARAGDNQDVGHKSEASKKSGGSVSKAGDDSTDGAQASGSGTATNGAESKQGDSPAEATPERKKKNRLSTMFSKLRHKLSDKN
ncbi:carbohydrate-binding module family 48 protein [Ophiocordyceps camponoti-floridani]|uniref:Carbohydrate-binding module family 48 protein n=1 Tax=Ophiocordyceps camponoti-floridani TaxID=2030778 RepID=A0A8H4QD14_9HYPO|nr:carbohydrate-binding module family 48 protein [Ophiocordyceps camponoti-floridani]